MKRVLYVSNIEVPYRTEFFNQLSEKCDLTVLYERKKSSNRDSKWTSSLKSKFKTIFLKGIKIKNEYCFNPLILKHVFSKKYDKVIIGCYNSPSQILAILFMRLFRKKYIINLDGEYFLDGNDLKSKIKRFLIKNADHYLVAGKKSSKNLSKYVDTKKITTYYFSSLTYNELLENKKTINKNISDYVLIVGQFFDYKGLDIALKIASLNESIKYKFIGSGYRSDLLKSEASRMNLKNVEVVSFLDKNKLYDEYKTCRCLLVTSRKECWGLVINEAASFGCPIISSKGAGAALEMLDECFDCNDLNSFLKAILNYDKFDKNKLISKNLKYSIDESVKYTIDVINL